MKKVFPVLCLFLTVFVLVPAPAAAQTSSPKAGVAFKFGVLGAGVDVAVPVGSRVNIRGGFSGLSLSHEFEDDGLILDASLKLRSASAHLDWFPFGGGFHLSPGVMLYNGNELDATVRAEPGRTFDLGNESYRSNPADPVTGRASVVFKRVAPSLMMGWGNVVPRTKWWSIPFELGVVFSKAPTATLGLTGSVCDPSGVNCRSVASDASVQADVRTQEADINDAIDVLRFIPVFSIGVAFSF
ncbi:MAG: hypothetical protein AB7I25_02945 [Vicinamibacterales bacterium]